MTSHLLTFTPSQCDGVNVSMNDHNKHPPLLKICCIIGLPKSHSLLCIIPIFSYVTPKGTYTLCESPLLMIKVVVNRSKAWLSHAAGAAGLSHG
jgi:hypothetical protein